MIIKFPKSFIRWKNHVYYALHFRVSVANLYKSGAKLGIWFIFWVCKNIYKHKILLTHSIKSVWPSSPPTHHDLFENDSRKSPNSRIGYFCFKAMMRQKEFSPSNKGQQWGPNYFHILYLLRWRSGNKTWEYKREELQITY